MSVCLDIRKLCDDNIYFRNNNGKNVALHSEGIMFTIDSRNRSDESSGFVMNNDDNELQERNDNRSAPEVIVYKRVMTSLLYIILIAKTKRATESFKASTLGKLISTKCIYVQVQSPYSIFNTTKYCLQ